MVVGYKEKGHGYCHFPSFVVVEIVIFDEIEENMVDPCRTPHPFPTQAVECLYVSVTSAECMYQESNLSSFY